MKTKKFWILLFAFCIFNALLYFFIFKYQSKIPFNRKDYKNNYHHFFVDPRIDNKPFDFLRALGPSDAQWYLKIASEGYPINPNNINIKDRTVMNGITYAFFPLYPIMVATTNIFFHNIELSAFILGNLLLVINFISLYWVISKVSTPNLAFKTIGLIFLFPFSIFYRSYFTEGLLLFFLIWTGWYFIKKKWFYVACLIGLIGVIKANALLLNIIVCYTIYREYTKGAVSKKTFIGSSISVWMPIVFWMIYCYLQTGDFLYFVTARAGWYVAPPILIGLYNILISLRIFQMPLHHFHYSKIDTLMMYTIFFLLLKSKNSIDRRLWWISMALWLTPLLTTDLMSFSRYQTISYPLFFYLAKSTNKIVYTALLFTFLVGLLFVSIYFINWYWIG